MQLSEAKRIAAQHEETYNNDFERYPDLYTDDYVGYRPGSGTTADRAQMAALERRATKACPDRKTTVLRVLAGDGDWMGIEERWEGTNTGGDAIFGEPGATVSVYAFSLYQVRAGKFVRSVAWTGRLPAGDVSQPPAEGRTR